MHRTGLLAAAALPACSAALDAQRPAPAPAAAPTPADGQVKGQAPDRGRPTRHDDEQPRLEFDASFLDAPWIFEWDLPEGPLGGAGRITGTTTCKALGGHPWRRKQVTGVTGGQ